MIKATMKLFAIIEDTKNQNMCNKGPMTRLAWYNSMKSYPETNAMKVNMKEKGKDLAVNDVSENVKQKAKAAPAVRIRYVTINGITAGKQSTQVRTKSFTDEK